MPTETKVLKLRFHGKILDQLGFQTYQSPVASLAELVSNSWDADAGLVEIFLPTSNEEGVEIRIKDNGIGMTFKECQDKYLNVGWNRRGDEIEAFSPGGRPILGRKGIGKFAGFGIANVIRIETVSSQTGEKTTFDMNIEYLRTEEYVSEGGEIEAKVDPPNKTRMKKHGTTVFLKSLTLNRKISPSQFARSMAKRFLLHQRAGGFLVKVNAEPIPASEDHSKIQFVFPHDYELNQRPEGLTIVDEDGNDFPLGDPLSNRRLAEWGRETLSNGQQILWRFFFYKDTIDEDELQGVAIYSHKKLTQRPFFFELFGGLSGQHGMSYLSGQVQADFVDKMKIDPISAERQRINWGIAETRPLLDWGQARTKRLLDLWRDKRGEVRRKELEEKVAPFSGRMEKLPPHEAKIVRTVLVKLGSITTLTDMQFQELSEAVLKSWEEGRLRGLLSAIANSDAMTETDLLNVLVEADTVTALQIAEVVEAKLLTIAGLMKRISERQLETAVRDYIANSPWIISPRWETFQIEKSMRRVIEAAAESAGFTQAIYNGRVDLVLSSGESLLVIEFMRPGLAIDWEHVNRFTRYMREIRTAVRANTAGPFNGDLVTGQLVADRLSKQIALTDQLLALEKDKMFARDWEGLLNDALKQWKEFLIILAGRGSKDPRLGALLEYWNKQ